MHLSFLYEFNLDTVVYRELHLFGHLCSCTFFFPFFMLNKHSEGEGTKKHEDETIGAAGASPKRKEEKKAMVGIDNIMASIALMLYFHGVKEGRLSLRKMEIKVKDLIT